MTDLNFARLRLDMLIAKSRVDLYKPIQIAEVLRRSRINGDVDIRDKATYQNRSIHWRNDVTRRLLGKVSTSSARYQHDIWNETAIPPELLYFLDIENKASLGGIENYIYQKFLERQGIITNVIAFIANTPTEQFFLSDVLNLFTSQNGIRRSIDKAYEIITYSLFETIIVSLGIEVQIKIPTSSKPIFNYFADVIQNLLGITADSEVQTFPAHIYRVGVTNAADRGLDMWANFGPAIQVKHITLDEQAAQMVVDQIESDSIIIVCRDADADVLSRITTQISWGQRVRGIVNESMLIAWYDKCLRGSYSATTAPSLRQRLLDGFNAEFPQVNNLQAFFDERGYRIGDAPP